MIDIRQYLPAKAKTTPSGWISFDAPCCIHNGETVDTKGRGGLMLTEEGWSFNCFNCGYKCGFKKGRNLNFKARNLLHWLGVDSTEIDRINLESLKYRSMNDLVETINYNQPKKKRIEFENRDLPENIELINSTHVNHQEYLRNRCIDDSYPLLSVDSSEYNRDGILIPFTYDEKTVGYTIRFLDNRKPKYLSDSQPGYVFGIDLQHEDWKYAIVTEGIFDALSIDALSVMHATISDQQADLISRLRREIIVVPDHDKAGLSMIDRALELGWSVSIPNEWPEGCKDINDAVRKLGKVATLITIIKNAEHNRIKIEMSRKRLRRKVEAKIIAD